MRFKDVVVRELGYVDITDVKKSNILDIIYFTDIHLGNKGEFRSDSITKALKRKVMRVANFYKSVKSKEKLCVCGGDFIDTHVFTKQIDPKHNAVNWDIVNFLRDFSDIFNHDIFHRLLYLLGNHDFEHGPDPKISYQMSPISILDKCIWKTPNPLPCGSHQMFMKHWQSVMHEEAWIKDDSIKILATHEAIMDENAPFKKVDMKHYETEADIVLCADIHKHQGVKIYNDTVLYFPRSRLLDVTQVRKIRSLSFPYILC